MSETVKTAPPKSPGPPAAGGDDRSWAATFASLRALVGAHPFAAAAIGACCAVTPAFGAGVGRTLHATGYVLACVVGIVLVRRFQHQTRFGAALRSRPAGWLLAALVWGLLHVPRYYRGDPLLAAAGVVTLVPLGLLWGYASDRTASLWPSGVAHALNVWGLQSF